MRAVDRVMQALRTHPGRRFELLVGEPPFAPPAALVAAAERAVRSGGFNYGPAAGLADLRELLGLRSGATADRVVITHGAKGGLLALFAELLEPGDEVIHPAPCYPAYPDMVRRLGGVPVAVPEEGDGFAGWPAKVAERTGPRTRAVVLSSPSNPSGTTLRPEVAREMVRTCRERGVRLLVDEAYVDFAPSPASSGLDDVDGHREVVVRVRSASKSWAVPGWRIGWIVADPALAERVASRQAALLNPPGTTMQRALLALDEVEPGYLASARSEVRGRLDLMCRALRSAGTPAQLPDGGFYLWLDLRRQVVEQGFASSLEWCLDRAGRGGVALWPGEDFGAPGWARLAPSPGEGWREVCDEISSRVVEPESSRRW